MKKETRKLALKILLKHLDVLDGDITRDHNVALAELAAMQAKAIFSTVATMKKRW